ncbi:MAG: hypothetical protein JXL80_08455 [Planctomycetes bacterium]|nr:hypothetical protein [Planctomycetota bacterium]
MGSKKKAQDTAKLKAFLGDGMAFFRTLSAESDRGMVLVGAAFLDAGLEALLRARLVDAPDEVGRLTDLDGPLSSFGSRIRLAFCLGLISREERDDLDLARKIRNNFAHTFEGRTFEEVPGIVDIVKELRVYRGFGEDLGLNYWEKTSSKAKFMMTISLLAVQLKNRCRETDHLSERPPGKWRRLGKST